MDAWQDCPWFLDYADGEFPDIEEGAYRAHHKIVKGKGKSYSATINQPKDAHSPSTAKGRPPRTAKGRPSTSKKRPRPAVSESSESLEEQFELLSREDAEDSRHADSKQQLDSQRSSPSRRSRGLQDIRRLLGSLSYTGQMDPNARLGGVRLMWTDLPTRCKVDAGFGGVPLWNTFRDVLEIVQTVLETDSRDGSYFVFRDSSGSGLIYLVCNQRLVSSGSGWFSSYSSDFVSIETVQRLVSSGSGLICLVCNQRLVSSGSGAYYPSTLGFGPSTGTQGSATQDPHIAASDSSSDFDVMEGYPMQQHPESSSQDMHALGQQHGASMFSHLKETLSRATRSEHATNEINEGGGEVDLPFTSQIDPVLSESAHVSTPATTPIGPSKLTPSETLLPDGRSLAEVQEVEHYILAAREKEIESLCKVEQRRAILAKVLMTLALPVNSLQPPELIALKSQTIGSHITSASKDTSNTSFLDGVFLNENWEYNLQTEKLTDLYTSYTYHVGWLDMI
ncbi:hypothetical protein L7F22_010706 [Adiantum nelumboides]|nr:hypothetical protein [Adiantum nelumboides]